MGELQQHDGVVAMELVVLRQSFAKHYGGEGGGVGGGRAAPGKRCGCPPTPPLYIGARGEGRRPRVSPRGRRPSRLDLPRENPRETCPPSQAGGGLPPKPGGGAPPPQVTWERVWGAHHPLVGWFAPLPLWPMRPSNTCRGSRNTFRSCWP